ncbi:hypothetical protein [Actinocorallia sp. A-T 12471]|uniref:hypothetical protein n=1 Tax=Actinocorallia sp. A-T 12471 TaxID=3089813 RepID=UPI0029CD1AE0|nr:hypothetical protein [Actinocorallia sp. A-T 12471]MDX6739701.1 hypothetical protein [Actinocorallia sp. A-T 12471]
MEQKSIPAPLAGRVGHIAGIESITLDGRRLYFGYDYSDDLVVSPLIEDPGAMARFAAEHLRQRTGAHDAAYWAELVGLAAESSNLAPPEACAFTTEGMAALPAPGGHLLYLLDSALGHEDRGFALPPEAAPLLARLGRDPGDVAECVDECLRLVRAEGRAAHPEAWLLVQHYLAAALDRLPPTWAAFFAPLHHL